MCHVVRKLACHALLCRAVPCCAVLCFDVMCFDVKCFDVMCFDVLHFDVMCFDVLCCACCAVLCCAGWLRNSCFLPTWRLPGRLLWRFPTRHCYGDINHPRSILQVDWWVGGVYPRFTSRLVGGVYPRLTSRLVGGWGLHTLYFTAAHSFTGVQACLCTASVVFPSQEEVMESLGMPVDTQSAGSIHVRE